MSEETVRLERDGAVAVIRIDDGKANALSPAVIDALHRAFDQAEKEAGAVLLWGRAGRFCAGFDLAVMRSGPPAIRTLVEAGAELFLRWLEYPLPIIAGCSGHALAAGALILLVSDLRIGARGDFKIGLNEVAIGMRLPHFAVEMARQRLCRRHFLRSSCQAEIYDPEGAVEAGFLDRVVDPDTLYPTALAEAKRLAAAPQPAFGETKHGLHAVLVAHVRGILQADMARIGPATTD